MSNETSWVKWAGGACPVEPEIVVDVRFRGGVDTDQRQAGDLYWHRDIPPCDYIIAYRVVSA